MDNKAGLYYALWKNIVDLLVRKGVKYAVLCPGSRCAPLALSFMRDRRVKTFVIGDERSAAYIALGIAQYTRGPVPVVCTSGTAAMNFGPAAAEAFFQEIPLLLLTADRPPEWIGQNDNQAISQNNIYGANLLASFELPVDISHPDAQWHSYRLMNEAVNLAAGLKPGPVHVNIPLREPLYLDGGDLPDISPARNIEVIPPVLSISEEEAENIRKRIIASNTIWVMAGLHPPDEELKEAVEAFSSKNNISFLADICSNLIDVKEAFVNLDNAIENLSPPGLLITFGGPVLSKKIKEFVRVKKPVHWHVTEAGTAPDTYQSLERIIRMKPVDFFKSFKWGESRSNLKEDSKIIMQDENDAWNEALAMRLIAESLPEKMILHLGNSLSVRVAEKHAAGLIAGRKAEVYANRGTSGIDGSLSTAAGAALSSGRPVAAIIGDMSFFYDRNALWHKYPLHNLWIIVINNSGGGIFRKMQGPAGEPELESYFTSRLELSCKHTALQHGLGYVKVETVKELQQALPGFFSSKKGMVMEVMVG